jgi:cob(I)alamin adenosyltransferase
MEQGKNMGNRLSSITTRTGDDGSTGLGDGSRTRKDHARVQAMGDVDELNSHIGLLVCENTPESVREELLRIQHDLFDLGGALCIPGFNNLSETQLLRLDQCITDHNETLPRLQEFILPGGCKASAQCHIARTVCRRAERWVVTLASHEVVPDLLQRYLNRLSDLLFVLARVINRHNGQADVMWNPGINKKA